VPASKKDVHVSNKWVDWRHGDEHQRRLISKPLQRHQLRQARAASDQVRSSQKTVRTRRTDDGERAEFCNAHWALRVLVGKLLIILGAFLTASAARGHCTSGSCLLPGRRSTCTVA